MPDHQKPLIQSVERALDILELIADHERPMKSSAISKALDLHSSTVNNIVRTLYRRGFLYQNTSGEYTIGLQCYRLGLLCDRWKVLRQESQIHLEELSELTGDNSILATESGSKLLSIGSAEGSGSIVITKQNPARDHLYCTAIGKVLMAYSSKDFIDLYRKNIELQQFTSNTITEWNTLERQFEEILEKGYSFNDQESVVHVAALAVPVFNEDGSFLCALGQSFPSFFVENGLIDIPQRIALLKQYAGKIQRDYHGSFSPVEGDA
jgi:DNA-binding IclR family transcriptional regulator